MRLYKYKALDACGNCKTGYFFSQNIQHDLSRLMHLLEKQTQYLLSYRKVGPLEHWLSVRQAQQELTSFFLHLSQLTHAGLTLPQALQSFHTKGRFSAMLQQALTYIQHGKLLSEALAFYPHIFDPFILTTLRMGEKVGQQAQAFDLCFSYATHRERMKKKIFQAIRYPLFLLVFIVGLIVFLFSTVIPPLLEFLYQMDLPTGNALPLSTRALLCSVHIFQEYGWILGCIVSTLGLAYGLILPLRKQCHRLKYHLPYLGPTLCMMDAAAFFQQLFMLQTGGIALGEGLHILEKTNRNLYWQEMVTAIKLAAHNGYTLSKAFSQQKMFPTFVIQILETGEKGGTFLPNLYHLGEILDHKTEYKIQQLIDLLNPLGILMVGSLLLWIVLAIFLPLYICMG